MTDNIYKPDLMKKHELCVNDNGNEL